MVPPINTNSSVIRSNHIAKIQNTEQHRDETQRRLFAMALQQQAARKKTQVQDSHKAEGPEIRKKQEKNEGRQKRKKRSHKDTDDEKEKQQHIDLKID